MTRTSLAGLFVAAAALAAFGAGCPANVSVNNPAPVKSELGFGKIPGLALQAPAAAPSANGAAGTPAPNPSVGAAVPSGMAIPSSPNVATGSAGQGTAVGMPIAVRPMPPIPAPNLGTVEYLIEAPMPSWGSQGDVLHVVRALPSVEAASGFAQSSGVPAQAFGSGSTVTSLNVQWLDADKFQWTFDAGSHSLSFWKQEAMPPGPLPEGAANVPSKPDDAAVVRAADAFLDAHGFSAIRAQGGTVQSYPQIFPMMKAPMPMMGGASNAIAYPCPMGATNAAPPAPSKSVPQTAPGAAGSSGSATAGVGIAVPNMPTRFPYPCGWWPQQATVVYGGSREGRKVVDTGGNPYEQATITVDLAQLSATNGSIQLDESVERSSYPLIDQDTAKLRLEAGGRNPIWPYGGRSRSVKVHLKSIEVVWMRYDTWQGGTNETYFLPGLLATGMVDYGGGNTNEPYQTVIPLLQDGAFDLGDGSGGPVPYMGGGGGVEIMPAPAPTPAPKPLPPTR